MADDEFELSVRDKAEERDEEHAENERGALFHTFLRTFELAVPATFESCAGAGPEGAYFSRPASEASSG